MYLETETPRQYCDRHHPHAKMLVAYVPCWPFEAEWCEYCEEVVTYWGWAKSAAWAIAFGWWWDGNVTVLERGPFPKVWRR